MAQSNNMPESGAKKAGKASVTQVEEHGLLPAVAISGMSVGLALGLDVLGVVARINEMIAAAVSRGGAEKFPKQLPDICGWLAASLFAFGLSVAICATSETMRRILLWAGATLLVGTWAPVLSLASHRPDIAVPWIATFWAGFCAMIYMSRHRITHQPTRSASR